MLRYLVFATLAMAVAVRYGVPTGTATVVDPPVNLQSSTPGSQQIGHVNVSGTVLAGTVSATSSGTSARAVVGSSTSSSGTTFGGVFQSASSGGRGVYGSADSSTGSTYGGYFRSSSSGGVGVLGSASSTTGATFGGDFRSASANGTGIRGLSSALSGNGVGVFGQANSPSGFAGLFQGNMKVTSAGLYALMSSSSDPNGTGVYGLGHVGVMGYAAEGTGYTRGGSFSGVSPNCIGVEGYVTSPVGGAIGGYFSTAGDSGQGVMGVALSATGATNGGYFESASPDGTGVRGIATASTGAGVGVFGQAASPNGYAAQFLGNTKVTSGGINALYSESTDANGSGVYGVGRTGVTGYAPAATGPTFGVLGNVASESGRGVFGYASSVSGSSFGGVFQSHSASGIGVLGWADSTTGGTYGVYGRNDSAAAGAYGVYSNGNLGASGTKSFRIDHPLDPENKYLYHYSSEGPEPLNVYCGNVISDARGEAWVQLPDYFEEINRDFRYTLTVVDDTDSGSFALAKVAREIRVNKFKIRTNMPDVKVSWRVEAVRNDRWMRRYGAPVEAAKGEFEQGTYQHPELYDKPPSAGLDERRRSGHAVGSPPSRHVR